MSMYLILVFISLAIFIAYVLGTCIYFGIPASISNTYYKLESQSKGSGWLFTVFCWGVAGALLPTWLDMTPERMQWMPFISGASLLFVGSAAQYKLPLTDIVHYTSAIACIISSQAWIACTEIRILLLPVWIVFGLYVIYMIFVERKRAVELKLMFWTEIIAMSLLYMSIIILI